MKSTNTLRTYSELMLHNTFEERFAYLALQGRVGAETFGVDRYLNQLFYTNPLWLEVRRRVIIRDGACDLGVHGHDICGTIYVHHMNPITIEDLTDFNPDILNPEYLISTSFRTHNAIHYGDENNLLYLPQERRKGDTCPWKVY